MDRAAVLIDGGYLQRVLKDLFGSPKIDYSRLSCWAVEGYQLFRTYYYDCLPFQDNPPTEEQRARLAAKDSFLKALDRLDRYVVRLGRLERRGLDSAGRPIFHQKRVDLQLGLDVASLVTSQSVALITLIAGDSDLIPAVQLARERNILVRLVVPPRQLRSVEVSYHQDLWDIVDERRVLTNTVVQEISRIPTAARAVQ